jgi:hypothetical protein
MASSSEKLPELVSFWVLGILKTLEFQMLLSLALLRLVSSQKALFLNSILFLKVSDASWCCSVLITRMPSLLSEKYCVS